MTTKGKPVAQNQETLKPKQIPKYTILSGQDPHQVGAAVNLLLEKGWEPVGGISCAVGICMNPGQVISPQMGSMGGKIIEQTRFSQAMIHYDPASITPPKKDINGGKVQ